MMNNNKILTVSYGTFSCTLEGFEDSFGTMKIIAEYFRDLAADDRYFGAEPPQPDAQMLARIAQTEMDRKVSAREQDGKIVLSALDTEVAPAVAAGAAAAGMAAITAAQEGPEETAEFVDVTEETAPTEDVTLDVVAAPIEDTPETIIEDISADDADVVDAVSTDDVVETLEDDTADSDAPQVEEVAQSVEAPAEDMADEGTEEAAFADEGTEEATFDEDENDIVPGQPDAEVNAFFATEPVEDSADAVAVPVADTAAPDSIAAKLQRIRAVVAQHEDTEEDDAYLEDEHAEADASDEFKATEAAQDDTTAAFEDASLEDDAELEDEAADLIAETRAELEEALHVDEANDAEAVAAETEEDADDVEAILNRIDVETASEPEEITAQDVDDETPEDDAAFAETVEDSVNTLFETTEPVAETAPEEMPEATMPLRKSRLVAVKQTEEEKRAAKTTRVIKVKRADLEAAIDKGDLEEYGSAEEDALEGAKAKPGLDDLAPAKSSETALSEDEQDELARELSALEEDIARDDEDQNTADKAADHDKAEEPEAPNPLLTRRVVNSRGLLPEIDKVRGGPMTRLLAETDQQMEEPESATRRDAFAHLRAAVAAKKADESMAKDTSGKSEADVYREDLAEAVRPRHPMSGPPATENPADAQSAPLKLVAEQRIDAATDTDAPVAPRRVSATAETPEAPADGDNFAAFASEMGATTLPQLLEAAAAYMSFVEGREQFSRPQLMTKVRQAEGQDDFSREDGLRSFGQLLRTGKIEKLKGGRFTVSEDIGYRPDQRAAG